VSNAGISPGFGLALAAAAGDPGAAAGADAAGDPDGTGDGFACADAVAVNAAKDRAQTAKALNFKARLLANVEKTP
jgi:hypothetical protein